MAEKIKYRICGYEYTMSPDFCPKCRTSAPKPKSQASREAKEVWKTREYHAGVIDSEGTFPRPTPYFEPKTRLYYLEHKFEIPTVELMESWIKILDYMASAYGGRTYTIKKEGKLYYRYELKKTEDLFKFLDQFIPMLEVKREDAIRLRKSLLAYKAIVDKGRPTREEWFKWLEKLGIR